MKGTIRIALVDDHEIVRDGIRALLLGNKTVDLVGSFSQPAELHRFLNKGGKIDVLVLDIAMPQMSGIELTRQLIKDKAVPRILILSANTNRNYLESALKAGVHGFIPKDCSKEEMITAIEQVYSGNLYIGQNLSQAVLANYVQRLHRPEDPELTDREVEILKGFANGMSYIDIADELNISKKTVESHKKNIFEKLNLQSNADLVKYAIKHHIVEL